MQPKIEIITLDHVQVEMPAGAEDEARAFYIGVLGFEEQPKPLPLRPRGGVWFHKQGSVRVHLGVVPDFAPCTKAHVCLTVRDLEATVAALEAAGIAVKRDHALPDVRRCYIRDPFGNRIELMEIAE